MTGEDEGQYQLLRSSVREFAQERIGDGGALKIEREGLGGDVASQMAAQGFVGARIPEELGGAGLDERGYLVVLEELARVSPSAAVKVLVTNSLFAPLVMAAKGKEVLPDVAAGRTSVAVAHSGVLEGSLERPTLRVAGSRASGERDHVLCSDADVFIAAADDTASSLLLLRGGFEPVGDDARLGFRGLRLSSVRVDSEDFEPLAGGGLGLIERAVDGMDLAVAAVSLGITSGALTKAIEYSKSRTTFEHPLKDYQPVAFALSSLRSDEEMLRRFIHGEPAETGRVMARMKSVELARNATKQALQVHGGYGYFEDFGVEKFYRDAVALSVLFCRGMRDMERLSGWVFGSRAGFL